MPTAVCTVSAFKEELNMSKKEKKPRMIPDVPATPIPGEPGKKRSNFDPTPDPKSNKTGKQSRRTSPGSVLSA